MDSGGLNDFLVFIPLFHLAFSILGVQTMRTRFFKILLSLILVAVLAMPKLVFAEEKGEENKRLLQEYQLIVTGLKCKSCIPDIRKALKKVPGVHDAKITEFDKVGSTTSVEVVPGMVSEKELISALKSSGFHAKIIAVGKPREVLLENEKEAGFFSLFN